jgi:hypothetical protein
MAVFDLTIVSEARPRRPRPYVLLRPGPAAVPWCCAQSPERLENIAARAEIGAPAAPAVPLACLNGDVGEAFVTQGHCARSIKLKKSLLREIHAHPMG